MKVDDLINWGELSRLLTGSRLNVRKNRIPKKYESFINGLKDAISTELTKLGDSPKSGRQKNKNTCTDLD